MSEIGYNVDGDLLKVGWFQHNYSASVIHNSGDGHYGFIHHLHFSRKLKHSFDVNLRIPSIDEFQFNIDAKMPEEFEKLNLANMHNILNKPLSQYKFQFELTKYDQNGAAVRTLEMTMLKNEDMLMEWNIRLIIDSNRYALMAHASLLDRPNIIQIGIRINYPLVLSVNLNLDHAMHLNAVVNASLAEDFSTSELSSNFKFNQQNLHINLNLVNNPNQKSIKFDVRNDDKYFTLESKIEPGLFSCQTMSDIEKLNNIKLNIQYSEDFAEIEMKFKWNPVELQFKLETSQFEFKITYNDLYGFMTTAQYKEDLTEIKGECEWGPLNNPYNSLTLAFTNAMPHFICNVEWKHYQIGKKHVL